MKFSYEWLQSYFDKPLPKPDKLAELLTMHSFETEAVGKNVLEIDVLPNRVSDCASHLGIAREISIILSYLMSEVELHSLNANYRSSTSIVVEVKEKDLCPRYMALVIKNVKVKESPKWLKDRLKTIGQKSINNIVDVANYVMLETGQPLHVFDLDKLGGKKIIVRKAKNGEKIETLDNKKINLTKDMLIIADEKNPLAIAGIKGGKKAEIIKRTKDIVIEAAVFSGPGIRQTSGAINLKTDASYRFEHGLSLFMPELAMPRIAALIQELAGGEVAETSVDICDQKPVLTEFALTEEEVYKKLGHRISQKEIEKILKKLSLKERTDIQTKEDLVEEVVRIYGYENIPIELPGEIKIPKVINEEYIYSNWIRSILSGLGFSEVYNYSFCGEGIHELALANPISSEKSHLRANLSNGLKISIEENFKNFDTVKLFEIGKVFYPGEKVSVAVAVGDKKNKKDITAELRGVADSLFISDADNYVKDNVFEIDLEKIIEAAKDNGIDLKEFAEFEMKNVEYKPFSKYPAVVRDISLFVPIDTRIEEVTDIIENTAGQLLIDSDLFDEYEPPDGEDKSFAFRLIFQSFEKTLTDKEVNEIMEKIINALEENTQWQVRKK